MEEHYEENRKDRIRPALFFLTFSAAVTTAVYLYVKQENLNATQLVLLGSMCFIFFLFSLITRAPLISFNIPNKGFWLRTENRAEMRRRTTAFSYEGGIITIGFLLFLLVMDHATGTPADQPQDFSEVLVLVLAAAMLTPIMLLRIFMMFRIPEGPKGET